MITLHHLHQSRSFRVVWLMEELGLPYDLVCHGRNPDFSAADSLRVLHRLGRAPLAIDGRTVLFESGAILEFVLHRYGQGRLSVPCHHADYADYLIWLHAAEGTCMPAIIPLARHAVLGEPAPSAALIAQHEAVLAACDDALAHRDFFGGASFTAADIMMETYIGIAARFAAESVVRHPRLQRFADRVRAREAFRRATEVTAPA